jgi:hypothetical protein
MDPSPSISSKLARRVVEHYLADLSAIARIQAFSLGNRRNAAHAMVAGSGLSFMADLCAEQATEVRVIEMHDDAITVGDGIVTVRDHSLGNVLGAFRVRGMRCHPQAVGRVLGRGTAGLDLLFASRPRVLGDETAVGGAVGNRG